MPDGGVQGEQAQATKILRYWRELEAFHIPDVPALEVDQRGGNPYRWTAQLRRGAPLPWDPANPKRRRSTAEVDYTHRVFVGTASKRSWAELIEKAVGDPIDEHSDERSTALGYLACFDLNGDGELQPESYAVASFPFALQRLFRAGGRPGLNHEMRAAQQGFDERIVNRSVSSETSAAATWDDLESELRIAAALLGCPIQPEALGFVVRSTEHPRKEHERSREERQLTSSFFLDELERVAEACLRRESLGTALSRYLGPPPLPGRRKDVQQDSAAMIDCLQPDLLSRGRWPAPPAHPLALAQQAAVGRVLDELRNGSGLVSVNGPPGTGKTTLLRDIVAEVVVQRARVLASFQVPWDAFDTETVVAGQRFHPLRQDAFDGHGIVVASSNNGAAENISKELPARQSIDTSTYDAPCYLRTIAGRLFEEFGNDAEAWGLIAAPLGNMSNRAKVAAALEGGNGEHRRFCGLLELVEADDPGATADWRKCASDFRRLDAKVASLIDGFRQLDTQASELAVLRQAFVDVDGYRKDRALQLEEARSRAESDEENRKCRLAQAEQLEQRARAALDVCEADLALARERLKQTRTHQRPKVLSRWLDALGFARPDVHTWRSAVIAEKEKQLAAAQAVQTALSAHAESQRALARAREELHRDQLQHQDTLRRLESEAARANEKSREAANALARAHEELHRLTAAGQFVPRREIEAPVSHAQQLRSAWISPDFDELRSKLFLAALRLHEATLYACNHKTKDNVKALNRLLRGQLGPARAQDLIRLWDFFFFVTPVASTTFASFGRIFAGLEAASIGWLLVDEAGQATCQAMVGALWRARRAVVVGDPLQIAPVITTPKGVDRALSEREQVGIDWSPLTESGQTLADRAGTHGAYVRTSIGGTVWTGMPLRVHRRCGAPMFEIANAIAYDGQMVQGGRGSASVLHCVLGDSGWFDVVATTSDGKLVPDEVRVLEQDVLARLQEDWPRLLSGAPATLIVISPFKKVAAAASDLLRPLRAKQESRSVSAGTVHSFQGKEADIVVLLLGSAPGSAGSGSRRWASAAPNLVNVAVTRARHRLYVIGNKSDWSKARYFDLLAQKLPTLAPIRPWSETH